MVKTQTFKDGEEIYREAHKELKLADAAYSKIYNLRMSFVQRTGFNSSKSGKLTESAQTQLKEYQKENTKHRNKYKKLMELIEYDSKNHIYRRK